MGSDYFDPDAFMGTAVVISDGDTLMVVSFNESGTIDNIEIISSILSLDNGIHVGLASTEMFSKYKNECVPTPNVPPLPSEKIVISATSSSLAFARLPGSTHRRTAARIASNRNTFFIDTSLNKNRWMKPYESSI